MRPLRASLSEPAARALLVLALFVVAGFVLLALAWRGSARTPYVPFEMPWLVSGGIAGLALIGIGLGALAIHSARRDAARHRAEVDDLVQAAADLIERCR